MLWITSRLPVQAPIAFSLQISLRTLRYCSRNAKPWITTHMMLCCTISSDRYITHYWLFDSFCISPSHLSADARRRMVQALRRKHSRRRLPSCPNRPIPRVPLREPLLRTVRGCSPCPEPRRRCQGTQRGRPRGIEHRVSQGVSGPLMEVYCIAIRTDATFLPVLTTRLQFMSMMTRSSKFSKVCPIYRVLIKNSAVPSL
jgi:hypothetical protein